MTNLLLLMISLSTIVIIDRLNPTQVSARAGADRLNCLCLYLAISGTKSHRQASLMSLKPTKAHSQGIYRSPNGLEFNTSILR